MSEEANRYYQSGLEQFRGGQYQEALPDCQKALDIYQQIGHGFGEARSLRIIGNIYSKLEKYREALDSYQQELAIYRRTKSRAVEADSLCNIGDIHSKLKDYREALYYRHHQLGLEQFGEGLYQEALSSFQEALQIYRKIGYAPGEANALYWTGTSYGSLKDKSKAIASLQQAIEIYQRLGDREGEARCRDKISNIDSGLDDPPKDTDSHQQERGAANRHHQLGLEQFGEGLYQEALSNFQGALGIHRKLGYASGEASSLSLIAGSYHNLGEYRRALDSLQQALEIYRETGDRPLEAKSLYNIANIYNDNLQDYPKAIESFQQALLIFQELGDREGEAKSRNKIRNIGDRPESKVERLVLQPETEEPVRVPSVSRTPTVDLSRTPSRPDTPKGIPLIQALVIGGATLVGGLVVGLLISTDNTVRLGQGVDTPPPIVSEPEPSTADRSADPEPESSTADRPTDPEPEPSAADRPTDPEPEPSAADRPTDPEPEPSTTDRPTDPEPEPSAADRPTDPEPELSAADRPIDPEPERSTADRPVVSEPEPSAADRQGQPFVGIQIVTLSPEMIQYYGIVDKRAIKKALEEYTDPEMIQYYDDVYGIDDVLLPEEVTTGALILQVLPDTPADAAGLRQDDVITKIDSKVITSADQLQKLVGQSWVGQLLRFEAIRNKQTLTISVRARDRGRFEEPSSADRQGQPFVGIQIVTLSPEMIQYYGIVDGRAIKKALEEYTDPEMIQYYDDVYGVDDVLLPEEVTTGALIFQVLPDTPADAAGLRRDDVITKIDSKVITSADQLQKLVGQSRVGQLLRFEVIRNNETLTISVRTGELDT